MARRYCYKDGVPFTAMVAVECGYVGVNILFKAATSKGMSNYIFITYTYAIASLVLLPLLFIFQSRAVLPPLKFPFISRICLLGLTGFSAQMCLYKGIDFSSPTLCSAVGNLTPAFTFILAILFRMEKVALRSSTTQAKIMGTIVSISGTFVVVLYKGPKVLSSLPWTSPSSSAFLQWPLDQSAEANWVIGGALLALAFFFYSISSIIQTQVMEIYPHELTVAFFVNLCATIVALPVSLIAESSLSSWRLTYSVTVAAVLFSAVSSSFSYSVHLWGLHLKGPVYVAIFKPLSIAIAAFTSAIFLGEALHLGSVIGAVILSMGFYAVIWGKAKEEGRIDDDSCSSNLGKLSNDKVPLLQCHKMQDI
ncbi:hypothetical protein DITRI_Ditri09bG0031700 [Diplodiscus trichospermus]